MTNMIIAFRAGTLLCLLAFGIWLSNTVVSFSGSEYLTVRFLDVGQGDSIQVITPDGYEMLIDGGATSLVLRELANGRDFFDKDIDVVIATHPDTDHIGGLVDVLDRYQVGMILESQVEHDASAAQAFELIAKEEGSEIISAQAGQVIQLGASTTVRILSPNGDTTNWESNTASIIVQVIYGDMEFLLTGDAPSSIEDYLVGVYGADLESEVLKLGHHGSKTATSEYFLEAVNPDFAVVSAGMDNRYGHPHQDVVSRVLEKGIEIVSTAESGTIVFKTDGREVWME